MYNVSTGMEINKCNNPSGTVKTVVVVSGHQMVLTICYMLNALKEPCTPPLFLYGMDHETALKGKKKI